MPRHSLRARSPSPAHPRSRRAAHPPSPDSSVDCARAAHPPPPRFFSRLRYKTGECYFEIGKEEAEERLEADKEAKEEEVRAVEVELASIRGRLSELKKSLYARFGKNINLEEQ
jgi:hypothetical protein